ncbi:MULTISPECIES: hypothetical protein [unclassified Campylobacter]
MKTLIIKPHPFLNDENSYTNQLAKAFVRSFCVKTRLVRLFV